MHTPVTSNMPRLIFIYSKNILIAIVEPLAIKLADFGLAKRVHDGTILRASSRLIRNRVHRIQTQRQSFCGTPMYMAPEIFWTMGPTGYDARVDSWSVSLLQSSQRELCEFEGEKVDHET